MGIVHALTMGTDAGEAWFLLAAGLVVVPALALLAVRMSGGRRGAAPAPRRRPAASTAAP